MVLVQKEKSLLSSSPQEDIMGKNLLNIVLDEQKDEVSEKIILNLPLANKGMYTWLYFLFNLDFQFGVTSNTHLNQFLLSYFLGIFEKNISVAADNIFIKFIAYNFKYYICNIKKLFPLEK